MEVKQHKKYIGILILVAFLLIVGGIITYIIINYNNDQALITKRMEDVSTTYDKFKDEVKNFNAIRDDIYNNAMQNIYYETLKENDLIYKEMFNNYQKSLTKLDKEYNKVKDKCINVLHPKASINNKCEALIIGYEEVVNTYISDIKSYNKNIKEYNASLKENNQIEQKIEEIKLTRDYIDVNLDRKYQGKQEVNITISKEEEKDEKTN